MCPPRTASCVPGLKIQPGNSESRRARVGIAFADPFPLCCSEGGLSPQNQCRWGKVSAWSISCNSQVYGGSPFHSLGRGGMVLSPLGRCLWSHPLVQVGPKGQPVTVLWGLHCLGGAQQLCSSSPINREFICVTIVACPGTCA